MNRIITTLAVAALAVTSAFADFTYTTTPAEQNVTELTTVTVNFPEYEEIEILSSDDIMVIYKGEALENVKKDAPYGSNNVVFTFKEPATAPGNYEFYFGPFSICGYANDYATCNDLEDEISIVYTIGASETNLDFSFTASPAEGILTEVSYIDLSFGELQSINKSTAKFEITLNGTPLEEGTYGVTETAVVSNVLPIVFDPVLTGEGTLQVVIPAGGLEGTDNNGNTATNKYDLKATYTLIPKAQPVVYDLVFTKGTPQFKTDSNDGIVTPDNDLELISIRTPVYGIRAKENATAVFTSADGNFKAEAPIIFNMESEGWAGTFTQFKLIFPETPEANGEYTITIPKGSIGDANWMLDPETGHCNDEVVLTYIFEGFKEVSSTIYDILPVAVDPADETSSHDLSKIVIEFPEGTEYVEGSPITLSNPELRFSAQATVEKGSDNSFILRFSPVPTEDGVYYLFIDRGVFGDAEYVADNLKGHANDNINLSWTLSEFTGAAGINAELTSEEIFNLQGVRVANSIENLPAGIYIRDGKKIVVK